VNATRTKHKVIKKTEVDSDGEAAAPPKPKSAKKSHKPSASGPPAAETASVATTATDNPAFTATSRVNKDKDKPQPQTSAGVVADIFTELNSTNHHIDYAADGDHAPPFDSNDDAAVCAVLTTPAALQESRQPQPKTTRIRLVSFLIRFRSDSDTDTSESLLCRTLLALINDFVQRIAQGKYRSKAKVNEMKHHRRFGTKYREARPK
jgi:hypothetical protein